MTSRQMRLQQMATSAVICTLVSVAGCARIETPRLTVDFGADYGGSSVVTSLDAGPYELRLQCEGAEQLIFTLRTGVTVIHTSPVACGDQVDYRFSLSTRVDSEVFMQLVGPGARGRGELFAA